MSLRTGIARLHNITIDDALRTLSWLVPFAPRAISWVRSSWKDPFKRYRVVQVPVEISWAVPFLSIFVVSSTLSQILSIPSIAIALVLAGPILFWTLKGKDMLLKRLREMWVLPDPVIAFDCVHCGYRHGVFAHSNRPPRKCKTCGTKWKDEWADYRKRPVPVVGEMYMDDFDPRATW